VVVGLSIDRLTQDKIRWREEDVENISSLSARPWALDLLANSLAPSIYGHHQIKKGLVLMLMGGMERTINKTHVR
jgi:DNA replication licensing factor MCM3